MRRVFFKALPYNKEEVTLALESGVDGLIVPDDRREAAASLARVEVIAESGLALIALASKKDEEDAARLAAATASGTADAPGLVALAPGWEVIPLENLLASSPGIAVEAESGEKALLAAGVLEHGAQTIILGPSLLPEIKSLVEALKYTPLALPLQTARITRISPAGMGHRVCVDTTSLLRSGQGMLIGNSAAFTFLVNAETENNEYVASRPFRINAGGVHAYALMPGDRTAYLEELAAGSEVLIVAHSGESTVATVGRAKVERRPMLLIEAEIPGQENEPPATGAIFLQNAETIRLVRPDGKPVSVVDLQAGDKVLCRADVAGRHFGMRISEDIHEA